MARHRVKRGLKGRAESVAHQVAPPLPSMNNEGSIIIRDEDKRGQHVGGLIGMGVGGGIGGVTAGPVGALGGAASGIVVGAAFDDEIESVIQKAEKVLRKEGKASEAEIDEALHYITALERKAVIKPHKDKLKAIKKELKTAKSKTHKS